MKNAFKFFGKLKVMIKFWGNVIFCLQNKDFYKPFLYKIYNFLNSFINLLEIFLLIISLIFFATASRNLKTW